jgi:hypothetical protein
MDERDQWITQEDDTEDVYRNLEEVTKGAHIFQRRIDALERRLEMALDKIDLLERRIDMLSGNHADD